MDAKHLEERTAQSKGHRYKMEAERTGGLAQVVEHLTSKPETVSSNPDITKKKGKWRQGYLLSVNSS
jgi:hypothetical protein